MLKGGQIAIPDLRAGFAYVMAALLSAEPSEISNLHFLYRGYENLVEKLSSLGAKIEKIPGKEAASSLKKLQTAKPLTATA